MGRAVWPDERSIGAGGASQISELCSEWYFFACHINRRSPNVEDYSSHFRRDGVNERRIIESLYLYMWKKGIKMQYIGLRKLCLIINSDRPGSAWEFFWRALIFNLLYRQDLATQIVHIFQPCSAVFAEVKPILEKLYHKMTRET